LRMDYQNTHTGGKQELLAITGIQFSSPSAYR